MHRVHRPGVVRWRVRPLEQQRSNVVRSCRFLLLVESPEVELLFVDPAARLPAFREAVSRDTAVAGRAVLRDAPPSCPRGGRERRRAVALQGQLQGQLRGQLRCGAHTDFGSHTIILADNAPGGLQVRLHDGSWIDVVPPPDSFIVNIGDLMMTWTNDLWLSNLHRVAVPPPDSGPRLSIAFFCHPNYDALIQCIETCRRPGEAPHHPPVRAGDYRKLQVKKITADAQQK